MHLGIRSICLLYLSSPTAAFLVPAATADSNGKACWRSDQHSDGKIRFPTLTALAHQNERQGGQTNVEAKEASADGIAESGFFLHGFEADLDQKMDDLESQYEEYKELTSTGSKDEETSTDPIARVNYGYVTNGVSRPKTAQL